MSLLRKARAELTGAWRSVRYDMGRRPVEPPAGGPDVTSTGMNTFGVAIPLDPAAEAPVRPRRRALAVTTLGALTMVGAAGAYLGVVNGLGSYLSREAAAGTLPSPPAATATLTPYAGLGQGPHTLTKPARAAATAAPTAAASAAVTPAPGVTDPASGLPLPRRNVRPVRTPTRATNTTGPECDCPPVPTPTAPPPPSPSPAASGAPDDPSPSPSEAAPGATSATPDDSAEPSESPHYRHYRGPQ